MWSIDDGDFMIKALVHFATTRRVTVAMLAVSVMLFGMISVKQMPVTLLPSLEYPTMTVRTEYTNAGPEEIELLVSKPIEESVGVVKGISRVFSTSTTGRSDVKLFFNWDADMKRAAYEVRDRMDTVQLPLDADSPILLRFNPATEPIMQIALNLETHDSVRELKALRSYADHILKKKLDPISGVAAVKISGGFEKEIEIAPDQFKMAQLGLSIDDISARLRAENVNLSGGAIKQGSKLFLVRTVNQFNDLDTIRELIVSNRNGRTVKIKDLAEVRLGHKDRESINRLNGREAIELAIYKEGDSNTVAVAQAVKQRLQQLRTELPEGVDLQIIEDQSLFIEDAIDNVINAALLGGLLAVLVIYLFLQDAWATFIIALLIPVSVVAAFFFMYRGGVSFNIMSLGGIALAVGLLVDNGIVVLESIAVKSQQIGKGMAAVRQGASSVGAAIIASTLTTVAVFLPLVFVHGIAGQLFKDQALTVTFTLLVSLVFALLLIPMLSAVRYVRQSTADDETLQAYQAKTKLGRGLQKIRRTTINLLTEVLILLFVLPLKILSKALRYLLYLPAKAVSAFYQMLLLIYRRLLPWSLANRVVVILLAVSIFMLSLTLLPRLGLDLIPDLEGQKIKLSFRLPEGETIEATDAFLQRLSIDLQAIESIDLVYGNSGQGNQLDASTLSVGENSGQMILNLKVGANKAEVEREVLGLIVQEPGVQAELNTGTFFDLAAPIEIELAGNDLDLLKNNAKRLAEVLRQSSHFINVDDGVKVGNPEIQLYFDQEKIASLGMSVSQVANNVVNKVLGKVETTVHWQDQKVELRVRAKQKQRDSIADVGDLIINPNAAKPLRLADVATIKVTEGPGQILRRDQQRVLVVTADLADISLDAALAEVKKAIKKAAIHPLIYSKVGGQSDELQDSNQSMIFALLLAVFLIYMLLASQFESLIHPFLILFSIPLSFIGAIWALFLTQTTISVVVFIGLIMLAGIVVNNAIVLIDLIKQLMAEGLDKTAAIIQAGESRLRPIIMTTITTILGLLPMVLSFGGNAAGSEIRAPMAITVIGGLLVATLLTLIVIPVLFSLFTKATPSK